MPSQLTREEIFGILSTSILSFIRMLLESNQLPTRLVHKCKIFDLLTRSFNAESGEGSASLEKYAKTIAFDNSFESEQRFISENKLDAKLIFNSGSSSCLSTETSAVRSSNTDSTTTTITTTTTATVDSSMETKSIQLPQTSYQSPLSLPLNLNEFQLTNQQTPSKQQQCLLKQNTNQQQHYFSPILMKSPMKYYQQQSSPNNTQEQKLENNSFYLTPRALLPLTPNDTITSNTNTIPKRQNNQFVQSPNKQNYYLTQQQQKQVEILPREKVESGINPEVSQFNCQQASKQQVSHQQPLTIIKPINFRLTMNEHNKSIEQKEIGLNNNNNNPSIVSSLHSNQSNVEQKKPNNFNPTHLLSKLRENITEFKMRTNSLLINQQEGNNLLPIDGQPIHNPSQNILQRNPLVSLQSKEQEQCIQFKKQSIYRQQSNQIAPSNKIQSLI